MNTLKLIVAAGKKEYVCLISKRVGAFNYYDIACSIRIHLNKM